MTNPKKTKSEGYVFSEKQIQTHIDLLEKMVELSGQITERLEEFIEEEARLLSDPEFLDDLQYIMLPGFSTLNFLHLLHTKYDMSYSQLGKILGVHRATVYQYMKKDRLTEFQDYKIKKNLALRISKVQEEFLQAYKIK